MVSGAQCLETPNGLIVASAGGGAMVAHGHLQRRRRDSSCACAHSFTAAPNRSPWRSTIIEVTALRIPIGSLWASAPSGNGEGTLVTGSMNE